MVLIYDVLFNFSSEILFEFFEWQLDDNIENMKKINLLKISNSCFDDLVNYGICFDLSSIKNLYKTCEIYDDEYIRTCDYCFVVSDGNRVLGIKLDSDGNIIGRSKMIIEEEMEVIDLVSTMDEEKFVYKRNEIINICDRKLSRYEYKLRDKFMNYIKHSYSNNEYDKLKYIYYVLFNKKSNSILKIYKRLLSSCDDGITFEHEKLLNLFDMKKSKCD